jgi:hypothetical protein
MNQAFQLTSNEFNEAREIAYRLAIRRGGGFLPPYDPEMAKQDFCLAVERVRLLREYRCQITSNTSVRINSKEFFEVTHTVTRRLGEISNSVWANLVALWHLREEVQCFFVHQPQVTEQEINDKFVRESGVKSADLRTTCIAWTWEQVQANIGRMFLFELCSMFEGWLEEVVHIAMAGGQHKKQTIKDVIKGLQFPTVLGTANGFQPNLAIATMYKSSFMKTEMSPPLRSHRKNSWAMMEDLLSAYRYFKECRNALIHQNGNASQKVIDEYNVVSQIPFRQLGLSGNLELPQPTLNSHVSISLRDIVALSGMIHRITITLDAALSEAEGCEIDMINRIKTFMQRHKNKTIPSGATKRLKAIEAVLRGAGLPIPSNLVALEVLMVSNGIL